MIRSVRLAGLFAIFYFVTSFVTVAAPRAEHVFIISIDGASPSVMERSKMPVLKKLVKEGACSWTAQTIKPSITLPAHTSMLTGVPVEKHKITWNNWTPNKGMIEVPTVFTLAKSAGFSTAMFVGKEKFRHFAPPGVIDEFYYDNDRAVVVMKSDSGDKVVKKEGNIFARMVATNAANYILKHKPNLSFIHFADADTVGHAFGWGSPEQFKALIEVDAALGLVQKAIREAGIAKNSVILVTSDHGGHGTGHSQGTPLDLEIPWIAWGKGVKKRFEITAPINTCDTAATALWLLGIEPTIPIDGVVVQSAFK